MAQIEETKYEKFNRIKKEHYEIINQKPDYIVYDTDYTCRLIPGYCSEDLELWDRDDILFVDDNYTDKEITYCSKNCSEEEMNKIKEAMSKEKEINKYIGGYIVFKNDQHDYFFPEEYEYCHTFDQYNISYTMTKDEKLIRIIHYDSESG